MKRTKGKRSLEAYKLFPYVAWGLVVGFSLFVYSIITNLQATTAQLQQQTSALEAKVSADPRTVDFENYNEQRFRPGQSAD